MVNIGVFFLGGETTKTKKLGGEGGVGVARSSGWEGVGGGVVEWVSGLGWRNHKASVFLYLLWEKD